MCVQNKRDECFESTKRYISRSSSSSIIYKPVQLRSFRSSYIIFFFLLTSFIATAVCCIYIKYRWWFRLFHCASADRQKNDFVCVCAYLKKKKIKNFNYYTIFVLTNKQQKKNSDFNPFNRILLANINE